MKCYTRIFLNTVIVFDMWAKYIYSFDDASQVLCYYIDIQGEEKDAIYQKYKIAKPLRSGHPNGSILIKKEKRWLCGFVVGYNFKYLGDCLSKLEKCKNLRNIELPNPKNLQACIIIENFAKKNKVNVNIFSLSTPSWRYDNLKDFTEFYCPMGGWKYFFENNRSSIENISKVLQKEECTTFPPLHLIYESMNKLDVDDIKVIILGQDPYHGKDQACGLAFAVPTGVKRPPSLINMIKEAENEGITIQKDANISEWAQRGVLLINTAFTVEEHKPGSHSSLWMKEFTPSLMNFLNERCNKCVIVLLGNHAKKFATYFGEKHFIIEAAHPSPLSAHKGFFGSKIYSKINDALLSLGREKVIWNI